VLERQRAEEAIARAVLDVVIGVIECGQAQALHVGVFGQRAQRQAGLDRLLIVGLRLAVGITIVEADMDVSVVAGGPRNDRKDRTSEEETKPSRSTKIRALIPIPVDPSMKST